MRAVLLEAPNRLILTDVERPALGSATEMLIKVKVVAVCGSEIHAFRGTHPFRKAPAVLGHEVAGEVVEVGKEIEGYVPGDRVFVDPQWRCGECGWCRSGDHNLCLSKRVLGTGAWPGALGEYIVAPVESVYRLPDHVSFVQGALAEPLSVGVHAVRRAPVGEGSSVVVLGAGPIGMMVAAAAQWRGASPIIAVDIKKHCLEMVASRFGATHTVLANGRSVSERIMNVIQGEGAEVVFLTAGVPALVKESLAVVKSKGTIVLLALFDEPITMEAFDLIQKDINLAGSSMYNEDDIQTALALIASDRIRPEGMVTHEMSVAEAQRGFEIFDSKEDEAVKVVLYFGGA